jgi:hypothetical protein
MTKEEEAAVRRIVREELALLLTSLQHAASDLDDYDTQQIESIAFQAVGKVAGHAERELPHAADCELRMEGWHTLCSCGL